MHHPGIGSQTLNPTVWLLSIPRLDLGDPDPEQPKLDPRGPIFWGLGPRVLKSGDSVATDLSLVRTQSLYRSLGDRKGMTRCSLQSPDL